jgi:uncharacterized phage protein gp47/JayE
VSVPVYSTAAISQTIIAQLESSFGQSIPIFGKAFARVLAPVIAGVVVLLYKYCGFNFLQMFVQWASNEETTVNGKKIRPLTEWGRLIGVGDPYPATNAELIVLVLVTNQTGYLDAYQKLVRSETNIVYEVAFPVALTTTAVLATVRAVSDQNGGTGAGTIGNLQAGDKLTFAQSPPNISRDVLVSSSTVTAADAETVDAYRLRIIKRFQSAPQGGAYADYRIWGMGVSGIVNVYPYSSDTPGVVDVYVEATPASCGNADGIPTAPQLVAVEAAIQRDGDALTSELANRRPVNSAIDMYGITRSGFDVAVHSLSPGAAATKTQISDAIEAYFASREPMIEGLSVLPINNRVTQAAVSGVVQEVADALGESLSSVDLIQYGGTITATTLLKGEKAKLASAVTYPTP